MLKHLKPVANRLIYFQKGKDVVVIADLPELAAEKLGPQAQTSGLDGGDRVVETEAQAREVARQLKKVEPYSVGINFETEVLLSWDLPSHVHGLADMETGGIVLNARACLADPKNVPVLVHHELAHAGKHMQVRGKKVKSEAVANLIAKISTGQEVNSDYEAQDIALAKIAIFLKEAAKTEGFSSSEDMIIAYYIDDEGATMLLQKIISITLLNVEGKSEEEQAAAVKANGALFKEAFPHAKISLSSEYQTGPLAEGVTDINVAAQRVLASLDGPAANNDTYDTNAAGAVVYLDEKRRKDAATQAAAAKRAKKEDEDDDHALAA